MDDNTPAAPVSTSDATPNTNSNPTPTTPAVTQTPEAPKITLEQAAEFMGMPPEILKEKMEFEKVNGGPVKSYENFKKYVSDPSTRPNNQPQAQIQQPEPLNDSITQTPQVMAQQPQPQSIKPAEGFITPNEYFAQKYNEDLAAKYPDIADYIKKGEYLKEATAWGLTLVDQQGNMNAKVINEFLELKAKAAAPAPTSMPLTSTPTVDYVHQEGDIADQKMADEIMAQGNTHPRYAEALKFTKERLWGETEPKQK